MRTRILVLPLAASTLLLAACSSDDTPPPTSPPPTAAASPSAVQPSLGPTGPASPLSSPSPAGGEGQGLVLGGVDLGVTMLGVPFLQAVAAVTTVLGEPIENPAGAVACIQSTAEVQWEGFRLAQGEEGVAAGWVSDSSTLQTPLGVTSGTDLESLERVYGASLRIFPPNTDNTQRTFTVEGADVLGSLSDEDTVESLYSSFCSGP